MIQPSIGFSQPSLSSARLFSRMAMMFAVLFVALFGLPRSYAQASSEVKACQQETCPGFCQKLGLQQTEVGQCVVQCRKSCLPPPPAPITIIPKYVIVAVLYAPPGCTTGTPTGCGTTNGSSFVDYNTSSSNGTKVSTKDSFQEGVTVSYDDTGSAFGGGGSLGITGTTTDTTAVNVTKTQTFDLKMPGNGDGIDHGQDQIILLLHPSVLLQEPNGQILWNFSYAGALYEVYVSELRDPSTMRAAVASVFNELGFTTADYQTILSEDPFGGVVVPTLSLVNGRIPVPEQNPAATEANGTSTDGTGSGPALDPNRFWETSFTFPYEATKAEPSCNSGVCNCIAVQSSFVNDKVSDTGTENDRQYTVDLDATYGVPKIWSFKVDTKLVWTNSSTTDNSTENKQTAAATITCPSTKYTGLTGMEVWWDTRYGSFVFIPFDPGAVPMIHKGQLLDSSGHAMGGQQVTLTYAGKTYHTYTASDGAYYFPTANGKPAAPGTAHIQAGSLSQTVSVGLTKAAPAVVLKMK